MCPSPYLDSLKVASQKICKSIDATVGTILITCPDYEERSNRGSHDSIRDLILCVLAFSRPSAQFSGASSFPWAMASSVIWQVEFAWDASDTSVALASRCPVAFFYNLAGELQCTQSFSGIIMPWFDVVWAAKWNAQCLSLVPAGTNVQVVLAGCVKPHINEAAYLLDGEYHEMPPKKRLRPWFWRNLAKISGQ